jgi:hypothetical protein
LRKNLVTGEFELYRRFEVEVGNYKEVVAFKSMSLSDALNFGMKECEKFHGSPGLHYVACEHKLPTKSSDCDELKRHCDELKKRTS